MSNVIDFPENWAAGHVACGRCEHIWVAARPATVKILECPKCGSMWGMSLEDHLDNLEMFTGNACCGQVDSDGVCCAPACILGMAHRFAAIVKNLHKAEAAP